MKSFDDLYRDHAPAVYRLAMRYVGRPEIAEEITSETFLALLQQFNSLAHDDAQFPAWLFTVAKRRAVDHWRRQAQEQKLTFDEQTQPADDSGVSIANALERTKGLKPVHRVCVVLRYWHGMSRAEIAAHMGLDEMQVKGHLQYALKLLKQELTQPKGAADVKTDR